MNIFLNFRGNKWQIFVSWKKIKRKQLQFLEFKLNNQLGVMERRLFMGNGC